MQPPALAAHHLRYFTDELGVRVFNLLQEKTGMWHLAQGQSLIRNSVTGHGNQELNKGLCIHPEILSLVWGAAEGGSEPQVEATWQGMGVREESPRESLFWSWFRAR